MLKKHCFLLLSALSLLLMLIPACGQKEEKTPVATAATTPITTTARPSPTPTAKTTPTATPHQTPTPKPTTKPTPTATPRPTPTATPAPTPTPTITPTFTPMPTIDFSSICDNVGAESYTEPLPSLPPIEIILEKGKVITVSTSSDIFDGDVNSYQALLSRPGGEGISLHEALLVTNNEPGNYTIRFDSKLKGSSIMVGSDLPWLLGGNVIINGDIDGDGKPDITLLNDIPEPRHSIAFGIQVASSGNTIYGLEMRDFFVAVLFSPRQIDGQVAQDMVFTDNTVSNMIIRDAHNTGIIVHSGTGDKTEMTRNCWTNTIIVNNQVESSQSGIQIIMPYSAGNIVEGTIIANNTIRVTSEGTCVSCFGIALGAGFWAGSNMNSITDTLIAFNSIEGVPEAGIRICAGAVGASENLIDGVQIIGNRVVDTSHHITWYGIDIIAADGGTDYVDPDYRPITYPEGNRVRDVRVIGNMVEGPGNGINIAGGCCSAKDNRVEKIAVLGNTLKPFVAQKGFEQSGVRITGGLGGGYETRVATENVVENVAIQRNTIGMVVERSEPVGEEIVSGGILLWGGEDQTYGNRIANISVSNNRVDSTLIGINLIGGLGVRGGGEFPLKGTQFEASNNMVSDIKLQCNLVTGVPTWILPYHPDVKGISIMGGIANATSNEVLITQCENNMVGGVVDDVFVLENLGDGASGNTIELP